MLPSPEILQCGGKWIQPYNNGANDTDLEEWREKNSLENKTCN